MNPTSVNEVLEGILMAIYNADISKEDKIKLLTDIQFYLFDLQYKEFMKGKKENENNSKKM